MSGTNSAPKNRLQPLREFTVQVRNGTGKIKGTAFAVQRDPALLVTCIHVVEAVAKVCEIDTRVNIYFPQISHGKEEDKTFTAKVVRKLDNYDDDIAILQLINDMEEEKAILLPSDVKVAILGDARNSIGYEEIHDFRSYGFRRLSKYQGLPAWGEIIDFAMKPDGENLFSEPILLQSQNIDNGMSGAPVLDMKRNLVVGIISETWDTRKATDRDTNFAIDGRALTVSSLNLELFDGYKLELTADQPVDAQAKEQAEKFAPGINFPLDVRYKPTQPPELPEWAGREEFLSKLDNDYADESVHITGLIGFGGEGKSSIAYRWLTKNALIGNNQPDAAFWWSFYENRSFESMVEALIDYLYGEASLQTIKGTGNRVNYIGAMALTRTLVLVLDGFEVMQEEKGDKYGTLANKDFLRLIELFAQTRTSYCLVTSRVPLMDFLNHSAYVQRDVMRLSPPDGRQLLENLSITGDEDTLDRIVSDWDGHALTVSLVGSYLREQEISAENYSADLFPEAIEWEEGQIERYKKVSRVLVRYDEKLTPADKAFLKLFSVFRLPVAETAFDKVFRADTGSLLNSELHGLDDSQFAKLLAGIEERRLIKKGENTYSAHPLVQRHYRKALEEARKDDIQAIHKATAEHYQETSDEPGRFPTLDDLKPYIEVVHHLCSAGAYDEAHGVRREHISQGTTFVIERKLGAFETLYHLMLEFFPDKDTSKEPQVSKDSAKSFILGHISMCLMNLGRLREAAPFNERGNEMDAKSGDHQNASIGYQNLAELYMNLGDLAEMQAVAEKAISEANKMDDDDKAKGEIKDTYPSLAYANHLSGDIQKASEYFKSAQVLETEIDSSKKYLYSLSGIYHAEHLRRAGEADYARRVTEANIEIHQRNNIIIQLSQCFLILGDLEADAGNHDSAQEHYEQAISIAGQIDNVAVKIQAHLARGLWYAKHKKDAEKAFADLEFSLGLATKGGYHILEADIRVALAWAHKANGDDNKMKQEAFIAKGMSDEMGYHWGKVDAKEVLEA